MASLGSFKIAISRGYGSHRSPKGATNMASTKLGRASKACKGKKKGAFRACVRAKLKGKSSLGSHKRRRHHKRR